MATYLPGLQAYANTPAEYNIMDMPITQEDLVCMKNFHLITDTQGVGDVLNHLDRVPEYSIDLETNSLDFNRGVVKGVAIATEDAEYYLAKGADRAFLSNYHAIARDPNKTVFMHNAKFDMHFMSRYNIEIAKIFDTMLAQHMVDENQEMGLKPLSERKLNLHLRLPTFADLLRDAKARTGRKLLRDVNIDDIPLSKVATYAGRDGRFTFDLGKLSQRELDAQSLTEIFWNTQMPFMRVLLSMEQNGFYIDIPRLDEIEQEFIAKRDAALLLWKSFSGDTNPNSPKQLIDFLFVSPNGLKLKPKKFKKSLANGYDDTDSGEPQVDEIAIKRLLKRDKEGNVIQDNQINNGLLTLLEFKKYHKLVGTYTKPFRDNLFNGYLFGSFNQTGTITTRLSSSDPNLQNIPGRGESGDQLRSVIAAPPGYLMVVIDYSQIELRLLAHYSRDPNMMKVFHENGDPHQMTADLISALGFNLSRKNAKSVNFGWAYGIGPRGLADTIEKASGFRPSETDTKAWLDGFSKAYPVTDGWKWDVIKYATQLGYVRTIDGYRRHLPELRSFDKSLKSQAQRQAVNSIIQGSAAGIIRYAMIDIHRNQEFFGAKMLAQVHDELVFICPEETAKPFASYASGIMVGAKDVFNIRVPILADPGIGYNWSNSKN